jgi:hypothetical protein
MAHKKRDRNNKREPPRANGERKSSGKTAGQHSIRLGEHRKTRAAFAVEHAGEIAGVEAEGCGDGWREGGDCQLYPEIPGAVRLWSPLPVK